MGGSQVAPECRCRPDVLDALRAAERRLREREILGDAQHRCAAAGGALVEGPHAGRSDRGVDGRKDVEQQWLVAELVAPDRAEVGVGQAEVGSRGRWTERWIRLSRHIIGAVERSWST